MFVSFECYRSDLFGHLWTTDTRTQPADCLTQPLKWPVKIPKPVSSPCDGLGLFLARGWYVAGLWCNYSPNMGPYDSSLFFSMLAAADIYGPISKGLNWQNGRHKPETVGPYGPAKVAEIVEMRELFTLLFV